MKKLLSIILVALMTCTMAKAQGGATGSSNGENITITANGVTFSMVFVKGGSFTMGATTEQGRDANANEKPAHKVTLSDYYIGETEVTQALWLAVMGDDNPSEFKAPGMPVELVSLGDCEFFVEKLNALTGLKFRIPTEAEWEFAARGGTRSRGYQYAGGNDIGSVAWYEGNSDSKTHPVKQKAPNELGLYDMTGNVWEWCIDGYGPYSGTAQTNPKVSDDDADANVTRGGSFSNEPKDCRVSVRSFSPGYISPGLGFRIAM
ncbi:MAG: SUMF1/EgtB/PvdO family nonheme iron enzyme [Prevotella sp.]|nr:SUMF1/EgtB/PvdO family nonheme iron enzyme [Prevotella sp.]